MEQELIGTIYDFHLNQDEEYFILFSTDGNTLSSHCSCAQGESELCTHRNYILAGYRASVPAGEYDTQARLIKSLEHSEKGRNILYKARKALNDKICPFCNGGDVKSNASSIIRILKKIAGKSPAYTCESCHKRW